MHLKSFVLLFILLITFNTTSAGELYFIVSGNANHSKDQNLNENNTGWGFEYNFEQRGDWIPLVTGASFLDSTGETSRYLGAGSKRRYRMNFGAGNYHFDAGAFAFLMTRQDYNDNNPFLAALPFVSFGNRWFGINATYVPKIGPNTIAFTYYQISFKLVEF